VLHIKSIKDRNLLLYAGTAILMIFSPAYLSFYLWSDDFPTFDNPETMRDHAIKDLRPVYGQLVFQGFSVFDDFNQIAFLRLASAVGLIVLMFLIHAELNLFLRSQILLPCLIFAFCTYPWLNIVYWATTFVYPWSTVLALLGMRLTQSRRKTKKSLGILLLACSSLIYPVATLFPIATTYLRSVLQKKSPFVILCICFRTFLVLLSVISTTLVSTQFFTKKLLDIEINQRVQIVTIEEIPEKFFFFFTRLIGQSVRFFSISSPSALEFTIGFVIVLVLVNVYLCTAYSNFHFPLWGHALTLLLVFVMLLFPFLIATDNQIDIRYFIGTNWLVAVLVALLFASFINERLLNTRIPINIFSSVLIGFSVFNSVSFFQSVVKPLTSKTESFIRSQLPESKTADCKNQIQVIPRIGNWPSKSLIGMASQVTDLASPWVPIPAIKVYLEREFGQHFTVVYQENRFKENENCIVDLNSFR